jgi:hypothetical protein
VGVRWGLGAWRFCFLGRHAPGRPVGNFPFHGRRASVKGGFSGGRGRSIGISGISQLPRTHIKRVSPIQMREQSVHPHSIEGYGIATDVPL